MVALELRYPQEAPESLEALLSYLNDWHQYQHQTEHNLIQVTVDKQLIRSELFIINRHFPNVDVSVTHLS